MSLAPGKYALSGAFFLGFQNSFAAPVSFVFFVPLWLASSLAFPPACNELLWWAI